MQTKLSAILKTVCGLTCSLLLGDPLFENWHLSRAPSSPNQVPEQQGEQIPTKLVTYSITSSSSLDITITLEFGPSGVRAMRKEATLVHCVVYPRMLSQGRDCVGTQTRA
jgi:hypothetical protein